MKMAFAEAPTPNVVTVNPFDDLRVLLALYHANYLSEQDYKRIKHMIQDKCFGHDSQYAAIFSGTSPEDAANKVIAAKANALAGNPVAPSDAVSSALAGAPLPGDDDGVGESNSKAIPYFHRKKGPRPPQRCSVCHQLRKGHTCAGVPCPDAETCGVERLHRVPKRAYSRSKKSKKSAAGKKRKRSTKPAAAAKPAANAAPAPTAPTSPPQPQQVFAIAASPGSPSRGPAPMDISTTTAMNPSPSPSPSPSPLSSSSSSPSSSPPSSTAQSASSSITSTTTTTTTTTTSSTSSPSSSPLPASETSSHTSESELLPPPSTPPPSKRHKALSPTTPRSRALRTSFLALPRSPAAPTPAMAAAAAASVAVLAAASTSTASPRRSRANMVTSPTSTASAPAHTHDDYDDYDDYEDMSQRQAEIEERLNEFAAQVRAPCPGTHNGSLVTILGSSIVSNSLHFTLDNGSTVDAFSVTPEGPSAEANANILLIQTYTDWVISLHFED